MQKKGLTPIEFLIAITVTFLLCLFLYLIIPVIVKEINVERESSDKEDAPFCTVSSHKNTVSRAWGRSTYCDNDLRMWTETIGLYSWSRADIECNRLSYGNKDSWRLPTWGELRNGLGVSACDWPSVRGEGACDGCDYCDLSWDRNHEALFYWTDSGSVADYKKSVWFNNGNVYDNHILQRGYVRCILDK